MHAFWNNWNLKPPVARKIAVRHTSFVCLTASFLATGGSVCLTASILATAGFVKLFHKIPWFFHDYSGFFFFKFHDSSMHGTFFPDFPGFPSFPELVGTPIYHSHLLYSTLPSWEHRSSLHISQHPCSSHSHQYLQVWSQMVSQYLKQAKTLIYWSGVSISETSIDSDLLI